MNLQQLEYIVAVDTYRHFATASEKCFVTQPTLSMMIRKLEEELDLLLFDRSRQPVVPTEAGIPVIAQARAVLQEAARLRELVKEQKGEIRGELKIGIIPTLAPYILPMFMETFPRAYPAVRLLISENTTDQIIQKLKTQTLDAGILATPLHEEALLEDPLFYEEFMLYAASGDKLLRKKHVISRDLDLDRLWLLEEGHCLRTQVLNLCELRKTSHRKVEYEAGSIDTLVRLVDMNEGMTIVPELAVNGFSAARLRKVRRFHAPVPAREISLVTYRHFVKQRLLGVFREELLRQVPAAMKTDRKKQRVELTHEPE